jgi:hypothetical protein
MHANMQPFYLFLFLQEICGEIFGPNANWRTVSLSETAAIDANLRYIITTFAGNAEKHKRFACMQNGMIFFPYMINHNEEEEE